MIFFNIKQEDDNTVSSPNFCLKEKNHKKSGGKNKKKKRKRRTWAGLDRLGARACLCPSPFVNKNRKI